MPTRQYNPLLNYDMLAFIHKYENGGLCLAYYIHNIVCTPLLEYKMMVFKDIQALLRDNSLLNMPLSTTVLKYLRRQSGE